MTASPSIPELDILCLNVIYVSCVYIYLTTVSLLSLGTGKFSSLTIDFLKMLGYLGIAYKALFGSTWNEL